MILITGASEGIGLACARAALERTDACVLITGRSGAKLEQARESVPAVTRARLLTLACDQSSRSDTEALVARLRHEDRIDGAVLCVGVNPVYSHGPRRIHKLDPALMEATIATNCTHTLMLAAVLLDRFHRQRRGVLILIGSRGAVEGLPGAALYSATKSFLSGLARAAAHEYGGHGVRVHLAHPGLVRTPRTAAVAPAFSARHGVEVADPGPVGSRIVQLLLEGDPSSVEVEL
jgi:NAD(P)-dependent dehydrogenase (short-subunit alcohol dehydrogenase family)